MENQKKCAYADINGIKMYYEIYGEGELPLVLIHGGGSTIQSNFAAILPLLADYGKIIAIELQAHGRTGDRDAPESFEQDANDVAGLLKHLNIAKANFLGYSDGGCTTLQIAISYPDIINKIIVISANYLREGMVPGFFEGMERSTFADMPQVLKDAFLKVTPDEAKLLVMYQKDVARRIGFKDKNEKELISITAPALIVGSDKDVILTEHIIKMKGLIPNSQLAIFPGLHGEFLGDIYSYKEGSNMPEAAAILFKEFLGE